jgi:hypothetical protein
MTGDVARGRVSGSFPRCLALAAVVATLFLWLPLVAATPASAALKDPAPSDPRATFVVGNVTTCAEVGFASDTQIGSGTNASAADANVSGTVKANAGAVQPGRGQELDVTIIGANVVIDAVVVKGGPGFNVYSAPAFLPPALSPDQHYIAPLNGGGNVPDIGHWFVCYHLTAPPPAGSLTVVKTVVAPDGLPVDPLPAGYSVLVSCDDGDPAHQNVVLDFGRGGGRASSGSTITGIAAGTTCTVVEQNTATLPAGTVVTYDPVGADNPGVVIIAGTSVLVRVTNDFSHIAVRTATLQIVKVTASNGTDVPATFNARVVCEDGTNTVVALPGNGGAGVPEVEVRAGSLCFIREDGVQSLRAAGWTITYSVDGDPSRPLPPVIGPILGDGTITITNTASAGTPTTTPTTDPAAAARAATSTVSPGGSSMAPTGASPTGLLVGTLCLTLGLAALGWVGYWPMRPSIRSRNRSA